jgi:hypothetical protein
VAVAFFEKIPMKKSPPEKGGRASAERKARVKESGPSIRRSGVADVSRSQSAASLGLAASAWKLHFVAGASSSASVPGAGGF